ncbi:MAG: nucleobase:cation symporter, family [Chloroflexota bacterium]|nr:nucleobase:cation symporter, family [Chloroflexota bacterium]
MLAEGFGMADETTGGRMPLPASTGDEFLKVELRGLEPVPDEERHGHPRELFFIWAAALADFFSFYAGALLVSLGLGIWDAILVLALGTLAGGGLLGALSVTGVRTGVPQIVFSRLTFGRRGAVIGGFLTMVIAVGWFSYDCAIAVNTAKALPVFGDGPPAWAVLLMTVLMAAGCILVAVYGHRTLTVVQTIQAPAFIALCAVVAVVLAPRFNLGVESRLDLGSHIALALFGFTATFALIVSWATYAADYSRYLPRRTGAWAVTLWSGGGAVLTLFICGVLGALVQTIDPANPAIALLIVPNLPTWLAWVFVAFIVVAEMSSNYLNIYTSALSGLAIGIRLSRWQAAVAVGAVGGVLALVIVLQDTFLPQYLLFLGATYVWFPAWCVVVLVDFWRRRSVGTEDVERANRARRYTLHWPALIAFGIGTLATVAFYNNQPTFEGVGARAIFGVQPADISSFVGIAVSAALFLVLLRLMPPRGGAEKEAPAGAEEKS